MIKRIHLFILMLTLCFLSGCGKKTDPSIATESEINKESNPSQIMNKEIILSELSQNELFELTLLEFKNILEAQMPNYRTYYKIPDRALTEEDWEQIRELYSLEKFGSRRPKVNEPEEKVIEEFVDDPDAIYYAPTPEFLKGLTTEEFAQYLDSQYEWIYGQPMPDGITFTSLGIEELETLRNEYIAGYGTE